MHSFSLFSFLVFDLDDYLFKALYVPGTVLVTDYRKQDPCDTCPLKLVKAWADREKGSSREYSP